MASTSGPGRQQPAVTERAEDPGVVGRGGTQLEELPFGGGDGVVEQFAQFVGEAVELLGGRGAAVGGTGRRRSLPSAPASGAAAPAALRRRPRAAAPEP